LILIDANILIYAASSSFPQHAAAKEWLDRQLNGPARVGLPWPSIFGFLRVNHASAICNIRYRCRTLGAR
jgi:uncharacterized protein